MHITVKCCDGTIMVVNSGVVKHDKTEPSQPYHLPFTSSVVKDALNGIPSSFDVLKCAKILQLSTLPKLLRKCTFEMSGEFKEWRDILETPIPDLVDDRDRLAVWLCINGGFNDSDAITRACAMNNMTSVFQQYSLKQDPLNNCFIIAAWYGHFELMQLLHEKGADIHAENDLAIRMAEGTEKKQEHVVQWLREMSDCPDLELI